MNALTRLLPATRRERAAADRFADLLEHPDRADLADEQALRVASRLRQEVPEPVVTPAQFRDALRSRLLAVAAVQGVGAEPAASAPAASRRALPRALTVAVGAMASVIAVGGVAAAGSQSLPGDPFYGVKRTVEAVQLATADSRVDKGERHLALAGERLDEVRGLVLGRDARSATRGGQLRALPVDAEQQQRVSETLAAMDVDVRRGEELLTSAYRASPTDAPLRSLSEFSDEQAAELERLLPALPVATRERAGASLALVSSVGAEARALLDLAGCSASCVPSTAGPSSGRSTADCDCPPATGTPGGPLDPVTPLVPGAEPLGPPTAPVPGDQPAPGQPAPGQPGPGQPGPGEPGPGQPAPGQPAPPKAPAPQGPGLPLPSLPGLPLPLPTTQPLPLPLPTTQPTLPLPDIPLPELPLPLPLPLPTTLPLPELPLPTTLLPR